VLRAGIAAVDAGRLVERALADERDEAERFSVLAVGKASGPMAAAALHLLGARIRRGLVVGVDDSGELPGPFQTIVGGHPTPTPASERAGRQALELAESLGGEETLLVLLSGGASALMAVPAHGLTLEDKRATTSQLLRAGADIHALNTVRKHLSAVKGGWLAARAGGRCRTLALSDVVGDDLSVIGSGPTVADSSTFRAALDIVERFGGRGAYPAAVIGRLNEGANGAPDIQDTPKPGDARLRGAVTTLLGGRRDAMEGAIREATARGYDVIRIAEAVVGEARAAGPAHFRTAASLAAGRPACVVSSGETTVRVVGDGRGGRNQELVLACADQLAALGRDVVFGSVGTDGIDGPTDAAGALADHTTIARARAGGLVPETFLRRNDAYHFFEALGDLIHTGPTGTNVGDLQAILLA
jgi:hydroxypyruvate reductase